MVVVATPASGAVRFDNFKLPDIIEKEDVGGRRRIGPMNPRLDHLGIPKDAKHSRVKSLRSTTLLYDHSSSQKLHQEALRYSLLMDAKKTADFSLRALWQMFELFDDALDGGVTLVGPRTFGAVLRQMRIHDLVLTQRLFESFAELHNGRKADYRDFLRSFITILPNAPVDEKLELLFNVYDSDKSGSLSLLELTSILAPVSQAPVFSSPHQATRSLSTGHMNSPRKPETDDEAPPRVDFKRMLPPATLEELDRVWALAREVQARDTAELDVWSIDKKSGGRLYLASLLPASL